MPGPPPKRSDQRRRRNKSDVPTDKAEGAPTVERPKAKSHWHPVAKRWFTALGESGQAAFYEPSDWATAELVAESMSRDLRPQVVYVTKEGEVVKEALPLKGANLAAYLKAFTALMVTEGDRRRARLELMRPAPEDDGEGAASVTQLDDVRRRLNGAG